MPEGLFTVCYWMQFSILLLDMRHEQNNNTHTYNNLLYRLFLKVYLNVNYSKIIHFMRSRNVYSVNIWTMSFFSCVCLICFLGFAFSGLLSCLLTEWNYSTKYQLIGIQLTLAGEMWTMLPPGWFIVGKRRRGLFDEKVCGLSLILGSGLQVYFHIEKVRFRLYVTESYV